MLQPNQEIHHGMKVNYYQALLDGDYEGASALLPQPLTRKQVPAITAAGSEQGQQPLAVMPEDDFLGGLPSSIQGALPGSSNASQPPPPPNPSAQAESANVLLELRLQTWSSEGTHVALIQSHLANRCILFSHYGISCQKRSAGPAILQVSAEDHTS